MRSNDSRELSRSASPIAISAAFFERAAELPEHRDSGRAEGVIADPVAIPAAAARLS